MDAISELINLLSDKDKIDFKAYLKRKNKRHDTKNTQLFDLLKTDDIVDIEILYGKEKSRDSYHALRKRLHDNLLLFISQKTFEQSNHKVLELLRYLVVGKYLLENNLLRLGIRSLDRAERLALEEEEYNLLNEVLTLRLQFAHLDEGSDLEDLSKRFLKNQTQLQREAKLQLAYAFLRKEINEIHWKGKIVDLTKLIEETIKKYKIALLDFMNYKSLYQILYVANEYAAINQNYSLVEKYVRRSYHLISQQESNLIQHVYYRLYILYFLANFNLRNRNHQVSLDYLQQMEKWIGSSKEYRAQFFPRIQLLRGLNFHFTGRSIDAIQLMKDTLAMLPRKTKSEDLYDLEISLIMFLGQQQDRESISRLAKLTKTDAWIEKNMGMLWAIRKSLMEILIYAEFEQVDLATARTKSFRRRYRYYLIQTKEQKVLDYVSLLERYFLKPEIVHNKSFQSKVYQLLEMEENRDLFNLSFITWLIARWEKRSPYEVTMQILSENQNNFTDKN